jgi:hypothetical protein
VGERRPSTSAAAIPGTSWPNPRPAPGSTPCARSSLTERPVPLVPLRSTFSLRPSRYNIVLATPALHSASLLLVPLLALYSLARLAIALPTFNSVDAAPRLRPSLQRPAAVPKSMM